MHTIDNVLPNEILGLIFEAGLCANRKVLPWQLLVSNVNRHWRDVALSTPKIWTRIDIDVRDVLHPDRVPLWIKRSGACLLDIHLDLRSGAIWTLGALLPHIDRWGRLAIRATIDVESTLACLENASSNSLKHLEIWWEDVDRVPHIFHSQFLSGGTPSLLSVRISGLCLECCPFLHNLTAIDFADIVSWQGSVYHTIRDILVASPSLRSIVLRRSQSEYPDETGDFPIIEIPTLHSLTMDFSGSPSVDAFYLRLFSLLVVPALECMELLGTSGEVLEDLLRLRVQSPSPLFPALRNLKLVHCDSWEQSLSDFLRLFPVLTTLTIIDSSIEFDLPETVSALIVKSSDDLWVDRVSDGLKARRAKGKPFTTLSLLVCEAIDPLGEPAWSVLDPYCHLSELDAKNDVFHYTGWDTDVEVGVGDPSEADEWAYQSDIDIVSWDDNEVHHNAWDEVDFAWDEDDNAWDEYPDPWVASRNSLLDYWVSQKQIVKDSSSKKTGLVTT